MIHQDQPYTQADGHTNDLLADQTLGYSVGAGDELGLARQDLGEQHAAGRRDDALDHFLAVGIDVVGIDERHFQVQLSELGLTISSQIFIAKASGNLNIAVIAGDHQDLFVELRGLRQREEGARLNTAGYQIISRPLWCALK